MQDKILDDKKCRGRSYLSNFKPINLFVKYLASLEIYKQQLGVISLAMLYVSCKLVCNILFFRQIELSFFSLASDKVVASALVYPIIYIVSDLIALLSNRTIASLIAICGIICDGLFSSLVSKVTTFTIPSNISSAGLMYANSVNLVGSRMWSLYYHGVVAAIVAAIAEILLFMFIFNKSKNFILSTVAGVAITLFFHNIITDYPLLKHDPAVWQLILHGWALNVFIVFLYACLATLVSYLISIGIKNRRA